jgi:hypothetical protein
MGYFFCEIGNCISDTVRGCNVLAEYLKQQLSNFYIESSYLPPPPATPQPGLNKCRKSFAKCIPHLFGALISPNQVKDGFSKEVDELAVENAETHVNKFRICDIGSQGNYSYDYGLDDLGCHHHKY